MQTINVLFTLKSRGHLNHGQFSSLSPSPLSSYTDTLECILGDLKNSPRPVVLFIHGDSFDWGSGNLYDGAVMAAYSDLVVVTINYRLGVLGNMSDLPIFSYFSFQFMRDNYPRYIESHKG